jgi:uncharacterized protein YidB (DUF937 family)
MHRSQVAAQNGGADAHAKMKAAVLQMLKSHGGRQKLVQNVQANGLGDAMSAWSGTGPNPPISADQVEAVLGADKVQQLAQQAGVSPDLAKSLLAEILPVLIGKLMANESLPQQSSLMSEGVGSSRRNANVIVGGIFFGLLGAVMTADLWHEAIAGRSFDPRLGVLGPLLVVFGVGYGFFSNTEEMDTSSLWWGVSFVIGIVVAAANFYFLCKTSCASCGIWGCMWRDVYRDVLESSRLVGRC